MMSGPIGRLVKQLSKLPGIGERSATRLAFHIMRAPQSYGQHLAAAITDVGQSLRQCGICCMPSETDPCDICAGGRLASAPLLVVSWPQDVLAVERSGAFRGAYHVLHGLLSPLDGIGPADIKIRELLARFEGEQNVGNEVILATTSSVEGDATAIYLAKLLVPLGVKVSRIASGLPIGSELEYADGVTLNRAIEERRAI